jgi:hypothetical protein
MPKSGSFLARRLKVSKEQLDLWNLHSLQKPASPQSKHKDKKTPTVEQLKTTSIDFDFASIEQRDRFERHFQVMSTSRREEIKQYSEACRVAESQGYKPQRRPSYPAIATRKNSEGANSESTIKGIERSNSKYILNPIPRFSVIDLNGSV